MEKADELQKSAERMKSQLNQGVSSLSASGSLEANKLASGTLGGLKALAPNPRVQKGGSNDEVTTEGMVLGATVVALIAGGLIKMVVDHALI
jgi:hypothetical protein